MSFRRIFPSFLLFSLVLFGGDSSAQKRPTTRTNSCTEGGCHTDATGYPVLHGPLNAAGCSGCHDYAEPLKHTFRLTRQGNDLCLFCHTIESGAYSHKPLTEKGCLECHNPHGGETKTHLRAKTVRALCSECHKAVVKGKREHEPIATGGCLACHAPHRSDYKNLLHQKPNRVCLDCHVVFADRMKQASVVHKPVGEDCLECHDAHASDRTKLLKKPVRELCFSCHEDIRLTVESARTPHGALSEIGECMNCHDVHASGQPHLLRNVTRILCLKCHDKEIQTPSGKIPDMTGILGTGSILHGPITINDCTECHQIHGGTRPRLLNKEFPLSFYSSFTEDSYELCFSCHDPSLALVPRTISLTEFRDGDRNLHFIHVNHKIKGLTCRVCHEIHAGNSEKQISNSVPFGDWRIPTGFSKTATGGSCSPGCHKTYSYDRQRPAQDNPSPANPPGPEGVDGEEGK